MQKSLWGSRKDNSDVYTRITLNFLLKLQIKEERASINNNIFEQEYLSITKAQKKPRNLK